jgi:hypothetical protein
MEEVPNPDGATFDRCAPYRQRGLTVIDLAGEPRTDLFTVALQPGAMTKSEAIDLPTRLWSFPYGPATGADDVLLVRGGPLVGHAHLEVDISDRTQPKVLRYTSASAE